MSQWNFLSDQLERRQAEGLYRTRPLLESPQGCHIRVNGRDMISFCSNDYLNLANDPRVVEAAKSALDNWGVGGGASHLVVGHHQVHDALEAEIAEFTGREQALCFSTGYMANMGVVTALLNRHGIVLEDKLNHASLLDAGKLSGARLQRYSHNDTESLESRLKACEGKRTLVVTDGVFSMDGDTAPLPEIAQLCEQYDALLMVDDAHGFGVLGDTGGGCAEHFGLSQRQLPVLVGTLGKSFGTAGAFVAGSSELIDTLVQFARTYIYTTALPPVLASATSQSLRILRQESWRRDKLKKLISQFRTEVKALGYDLMPSQTPIQPIVIGNAEQAVEVSDFLAAEGILIPAIRPPTVPVGTARLRVTFSAGHSEDDLRRLTDALARIKKQLKRSLSEQ